MIQKLKIYEFDFGGARDWVIAYTKESAIETHKGESGMYKEDYDDCKIFKILKKNWKNYNYWEETPDNTMTFKEYMKNKAYKERFFCSTEF